MAATTPKDQTPAARAAEQLLAGDVPQPRASSLRGRARAGLRSVLLRVLRPYTHPQRELDERVVAALREHETDLARLDADIRRREDRLERLEVFVSDMVAAVEALRQSALRSDARANELEWVARELRAQPYMSDAPLAAFDHEGSGRVLGFRDARAPGDPAGELAFQEVFRGPSSRVGESQRPYLSLVSGHAPVLDIGCGRGEFLELLGAEGIPARGVDVDPGMVEACRARGLSEVVQADANDHLAGLQSGEVGAIFAAQVLEHMSYDAWRRFLTLAVEKLRPGGVLLFETVNPHRVASLKTFWVDPSHRHPIFPEAALVICRLAGFSEAWAFVPEGSNFELDVVTSPVYAVLARKSKSGPD